MFWFRRLAGQLGRFAPSLSVAHVSASSPKSTTMGLATRRRAPEHAHINERTSPMTTGIVKFYNGQRGFGFIAPENGDKDVFVHATALERAGIHALHEGQKVKFDTEKDSRSGKIAVGTIEIA
jgi:cold shock protein